MNVKNKPAVYIGTAGWSYGWENYYADQLPGDKRLEQYCQLFRTAEVNYSFYQLPHANMCRQWLQETTDSFLFTLKLSRSITHINKLNHAEDMLLEFFKRIKSLNSKLGSILIQLPPAVSLDAKRLKNFLSTVKEIKQELKMQNVRLAFEFRHRSWLEPSDDRDAILEILRQHNAAMVFAHSSRYPYPEDEPVTADFVYLRFHGPVRLFASKYETPFLERCARKIQKWLKNDLDVMAYFNNDADGHSFENAKTLIELTGI
jgi:uncharacterized protein YecE (DUF72 family)